LDALEKTDLKKAEDRGKLLIIYDLQLEGAKKEQENAKIEIQNSIDKVKEYGIELTILEGKDAKIFIKMTEEKIEEKMKEIEIEKKVVDKELLVKKQENHEVCIKKSAELGFPTVDDYYEFFDYADQFCFSFQKLEELSKRVGCKIKNYPSHMSLQAKKIENQINNESTAHITQILNLKMFNYLQAQNQNLNINPDTFGKTISTYLTPNEKIFFMEDVLIMCDKHYSDIVNIMNKPEKAREAAKENLIERFLQTQGDKTSLESDMEDLIKKKETTVDDDDHYKLLNEELDAINQNEEEEEDSEEKKSLNCKKNEKKKEITAYKAEFTSKKKEIFADIKKLKANIKDFDKNMNEKQKKAFNALNEILRICTHWLDNGSQQVKIKNIQLPVEYFLNEVAFESRGKSQSRKSIKN